ncbi:hypothetical protein V490_05994 [Pseudogymnoascus sp. VKM F-3557]|nr:hypothetical protein V490_05994 [Pseudogymnoascus sp. VKM F-3557]
MAVPMPPPPGKQPKVPNLPKRMWVTKLSLRCISAAFCLVIIGSCAGTYWIYPELMAPAGGVLIWDIAEGITLIVRRRSYKGIHPGACVGVDLVLWLALGALSGVMAPAASYSDVYSYSSYESYRSYDRLTDATLLIVAISFGFIVTYELCDD